MGISRKQALDCFRSDDLIGIGMEADEVRRRLHPEDVVTYPLQLSITATPEPMGIADLLRVIGEATGVGCTGVDLHGGFAELSIEHLAGLLGQIKQQYAGLSVRCLSAADILRLARGTGTGAHDIIRRLEEAGADSILGRCSDELPLDAWLEVHRTAHRLGLRTVAMLTVGAGELPETRVDALERICRLQGETGGFIAFEALVASRSLSVVDQMTSVEYLKTVAISRMLLDNIEHMQTDWTTQGLKVLQMALRFGVDDAGSPVLDAGRLRSGSSETASEEELRRLIRDAGLRPAQRDALYRVVSLD